MPDLKKSEVIENLLTTMINISGRKTNKGHALFTMNNTIKQLENKFDFLKNVQIKDIRYSEDEDPVSVMTGLDEAKPGDLGNAIHDLITNMNKNLGKDAGHFFIKELRTKLDDDNLDLIKGLGVDLGLMQLEYEVEEMERYIVKKREEK